MKTFGPIVLGLVWCLTACGGGDSGDCLIYCNSMDAAGAYGEWTCNAEDKIDVNGFCFERIVVTATDENDDLIPLCYRDEADLPAGVEIPDTAPPHLINNPSSLDSCRSQCDANSQGDAMDEELVQELAESASLNSFLQAQLNQQCRVEADERK